MPTGEFWFQLQRRTVSLKTENASIFYFRDCSPVVEARDAKRLAREKQLVMATSSHELRTPLNGMITMLDMIEHDPSQRRRYIGIARMSTRMMLSLVNDMLDFSAILSH